MAKEIVIVLDKSANAKDFRIHDQEEKRSMNADADTLIHQDEFKKARGIIQNNIPKNEEDANKIYLHNTITVLGTRGSGKTSFLLSIKKSFEENKEVEVLDIIDPTLIEEKGHVFLNTISLIMGLVEKQLDKEECNPPNDITTVITRKQWRSTLGKLAAGLPSIDGLASRNVDSWQDPEFVMDNGLKAVAASQKLAENFNEFLKISLHILNKKSFLLMFDDIDVDASKGWTVLEAIRKYFTSKRMTTLISGDLKLYSTVVRQRKWENFGGDILKYEGKYLNKLHSFNSMMTELESQYLQKILQPRYRIHLPTIAERKRNEHDTKIYVYATDSEKKGKHEEYNEIEYLYIHILKYFGIVNKYQAEAYYTYILGLPLRTQIQFLSLFEIPSGKYILGKNGLISLTDVFLSDLNASGIDVNTAVNNPKSLNRIVLDFLLKEKKLEELYQLQPITTNYSLNASLIALNFLLSYNVRKDSYLIFDYFIKIGYIRNLVPLIGYRKSSESVLTPSIEDLCENSIVINDNVLKDVTGKITAYLRGAIDKEGTNTDSILKGGTIPLYGEAKTSKGNQASMSNRIDRVLKEEANFIEYMLVYLPLSSNQYILKQSSLLTYSIYLLLSSIGELIRKVKFNDVASGFSELSQLRSYMMPNFRAGSSETTIEANTEPQKRPARKEDDIPIENLFGDWANKYGEQKISTHLLGKISTRFFFAQTAIENNASGKKLGEVFHAHIIAFMNAVLVEDCRENTDFGSDLTLSNTNFSNNNFIYNLEIVLKKRADIPNNISPDNSSQKFEQKIEFSKWLLSCPLFLAYLRLDDDEKLKKNIISYCGLQKDYRIFDLHISTFLDEISIKRQQNLSMNRPNDYETISELLEEKKLALQSADFNAIKSNLEELGIGTVTEKSFEKYKKWKSNNQGKS